MRSFRFYGLLHRQTRGDADNIEAPCVKVTLCDHYESVNLQHNPTTKMSERKTTATERRRCHPRVSSFEEFCRQINKITSHHLSVHVLVNVDLDSCLLHYVGFHGSEAWYEGGRLCAKLREKLPTEWSGDVRRQIERAVSEGGALKIRSRGQLMPFAAFEKATFESWSAQFIEVLQGTPPARCRDLFFDMCAMWADAKEFHTRTEVIRGRLNMFLIDPEAPTHLRVLHRHTRVHVVVNTGRSEMARARTVRDLRAAGLPWLTEGVMFKVLNGGRVNKGLSALRRLGEWLPERGNTPVVLALVDDKLQYLNTFYETVGERGLTAHTVRMVPRAKRHVEPMTTREVLASYKSSPC